MKINGRLTMGENIGDLSGIAVAYRAYQISLNGKPAPVIGGFTGDQRFFLGYAQIWRTKSRDEALRNQLLTDPHSPGILSRVRAAHQHRRVLRRLQPQARRQAVPGARGAREDLVAGRAGGPRTAVLDWHGRSSADNRHRRPSYNPRAMPLQVGTRIGAYEVVGALGAGGWAKSTARATRGSGATSP